MRNTDKNGSSVKVKCADVDSWLYRTNSELSSYPSLRRKSADSEFVAPHSVRAGRARENSKKAAAMALAELDCC